MTRKPRLLAFALAAVLVMVAGGAQAALFAGWDFSQFRGAGFPSTDGVSNTTTLAANYSSLDPTFNAGAESAAFGTASWTGPILPCAGSLQANRLAPTADLLSGSFTTFGTNPFDSLTILDSEGQTFQQLLALTTRGGSSTVTFEVTGAPTGEDWAVSFGGKTFSGTSSVNVEFSTNGSSFSSVGTAALDTDEETFRFPLGTNPGSNGFVRLSLDDAAGQPIIDNVAVPEPGMTGMLLMGTLLVGALGRRRIA